MDFKDLVGRTIRSVATDDARGYLCFHTDAGFVLYEADGDCCSESWFNHVVNAAALIDATVSRVDVAEERSIDAEAGDPDFSGRQEVDRIYGFIIHTTKGSCQIELRNSSNGYYGGSVNRVAADNFRGCQKHDDCRESVALGIACAGGVWRLDYTGKPHTRIAVPVTEDF